MAPGVISVNIQKQGYWHMSLGVMCARSIDVLVY